MSARLFSLFCVAALLLCRPLAATWSIVLVNVRTGEVAVASATCLEGFDLAAGVPVVVVGRGAAAAQSRVDGTGANRLLIRDQLRLGTDPLQILGLLALRDPDHQTRQYGMVDIRGRAIGFTGGFAGAYAGDRVGQVGDIAYAIQGNVLTAGAVLAAAELALYTTPGDLGEKLMAAMEAAASYGGDGRCSCTGGDPTGCGAPPPSFRKSADVAFMIVARAGDTDGACNSALGCATGNYYMRLNVANQRRSDPDPVLTLRTLYGQWKSTQIGRPDHILSTASFDVVALPNNGVSRTALRMQLRDRDGVALQAGGASVQVAVDPNGVAVSAGAVVDNGDGTYVVPITAGVVTGEARLLVTIDDGSGPRQLMPAPSITIERNGLWLDREELSVSQGGRVQFALDSVSSLGFDKPWFLLASNSGTRPGLRLSPTVFLALNFDSLLQATAVGAFLGVVPELAGRTDPNGRAFTSLAFPPGLYGLPLGSEIAFSWVMDYPVISLAGPARTVRIVR